MINTTRTLFVTGDTAPTLSGVVTSGTTPATVSYTHLTLPTNREV